MLCSVLILFCGSANLFAQDDCPNWARQKLVQIQQAAVQAGYEYGRTWNIARYNSRMEELNAAVSQLPAGCLQQSREASGSGQDYRCRQLWADYRRCVREFNYKIAAGMNPPYRCYRPNCPR